MSNLKTMQNWFDAYGESHQNPVNEQIHWICVPTIFFSLLGLLSLIPVSFFKSLFSENLAPYMHVGTILIVLGLIFFIRLSLAITVGMLIISSVMLYLVKVVNVRFTENALFIYLILFVVAWIGQFIGHKIEGKKPSFLDDVKFLMIGPAWLLHFVYKKIGIGY